MTTDALPDQWVYRRAEPNESQVHGPFTGEQIYEWFAKGERPRFAAFARSLQVRGSSKKRCEDPRMPWAAPVAASLLLRLFTSWCSDTP